MAKYLMALDAGIGGGRCVVFDADGEIACSNYAEWTYEWPEGIPGAVEFRADGFWKLLAGVVRKSLTALPGGASEIAAISATSMREGFVLLDRTGREVYSAPPFDGRGAALNALLAEEMGEQIYRETGHWPASFHAPGRILWLQENLPALWREVDTLLMIADWVLFRLTGERSGEPSNLCSAVLVDARTRAWSSTVIERIHLPRCVLPSIGSAGELLGRVTAGAADETGLREGTPVIIGGGDAQCGLIGMGVARPGLVGAVAGTTTPILLAVNQSLLDTAMRLWTRCHAVPGLWCLEANAGMTGIVYRWVRDISLEIGGTADTGLNPYDLMNVRASDVPPGANGVVVIASTRMDARSIDHITAPGAILGINPIAGGRAPYGEIVRATLEGISFSIRSNIGLLEQVSATRLSELRICGGLTRSSLWAQMLSDVLRIPVLVAGSEEATALGAAILAGVGCGTFSNVQEGIEAAVRFSNVIQPNPIVSDEYDRFYNRWLQLNDALAPLRGDLMQVSP